MPGSAKTAKTWRVPWRCRHPQWAGGGGLDDFFDVEPLGGGNNADAFGRRCGRLIRIVGHGVAVLHPHAGARESEGIFKVLLKLGAHDGQIVFGLNFCRWVILGNCTPGSRRCIQTEKR